MVYAARLLAALPYLASLEGGCILRFAVEASTDLVLLLVPRRLLCSSRPGSSLASRASERLCRCRGALKTQASGGVLALWPHWLDTRGRAAREGSRGLRLAMEANVALGG